MKLIIQKTTTQTELFELNHDILFKECKQNKHLFFLEILKYYREITRDDNILEITRFYKKWFEEEVSEK